MLPCSRYLAAREWPFAEIMVVNDGSTDGTAAVAEEFARERTPASACSKNPGNRGKGYSVRHGMLEAKGDWILFTDADLSAPIEELDKLIAAAARARAPRSPSDRARWTAA